MDERWRRAIGRVLVVGLLAGPLAVVPWMGRAAAATMLVVDQAADEAPDPGDQCTAAPADCSLRQAVDAAVDGDTVEIGEGIDPVVSLGDIVTTKDLVIQGQGPFETVIDANHSSRIFRFEEGAVATVRDVTLREGQAVVDGFESGGAVFSLTSLELERVRVLDSRAKDGSGVVIGTPLGGHGGSGGGVFAVGVLRVRDSTFVGNRAGAGANIDDPDVFGGLGGSGGAIFYIDALIGVQTELEPDALISRSAFLDNAAGDGGTHPDPTRAGPPGSGGAVLTQGFSTSLLVVNSTFSGNRTGSSTSSAGSGGALSGSSGATVDHSTFVGNEARTGGSAAGSGGAIAGVLTITRSILVDNIGGSGGAGHACGGFAFALKTIVHPADPACASAAVVHPWPGGTPAPVLDGLTEVVPLPSGSPAIDMIPAESCDPAVPTDQRGQVRPTGAGCDPGAFEFVPAPTTTYAHPVLLRLTGGISLRFPLGARLTGPGGAAVGGQVLRFTVGGRQVCTATTSGSGWASCGSLRDMLAAIVNGGFTATFDGSPTLQGSSDSAGLIG